MEKREKIIKYYQKHGVTITEEAMEEILKDKERTNDLMRLYKQEELESMNYILGKPEDNKCFTKFELEFMNKIDLFNRNVVKICKKIYEKECEEEK